MNKIQKLIVSMRVVIHLWKLGFYFSDNSHVEKEGIKFAGYWGFHRLNFDDGNREVYAIIDIDFSENIPTDECSNKVSYFKMHLGPGKSIIRRDVYSNGYKHYRVVER